jgi:hypothetical protein
MPDLPILLPFGRRLVARAVLAVALPIAVAGCSLGAASPAPAGSSGPSASPLLTGPTVGAIDHKTGATDVVLRLEEGGGFVPIDFLASQAPTFTVYGSGVVVFQPRPVNVPRPDASGVVHGIPWRTAKLDEGQIQELLEFALGPGGLGAARESYVDNGIADAPNTIFTVHAGGVDKTVVVNALAEATTQGPDTAARAQFFKVAERLRDFDRGGSISTDMFESDRYRGVLIEREPQAGPTATPWPWPSIPLTDFKEVQTPDGGTSFPKRTLSPAEVDAIGIKDAVGGLQGVVLAGANGKGYTLIVRPLLPEEAG